MIWLRRVGFYHICEKPRLDITLQVFIDTLQSSPQSGVLFESPRVLTKVTEAIERCGGYHISAPYKVSFRNCVLFYSKIFFVVFCDVTFI